MSRSKIVLLAGPGISTRVLYHALKDEFEIDHIILEAPVSKKQLIFRRIKKLGLLTVIGQVFFQLMVVNLLNFFSASRKKQILTTENLHDMVIPAEKIMQVSSVNDDRCLELIQTLDPQLVVVNGTRIISERILLATAATFIDMHAGITPAYRGVHGAYWALVNGDAEHCGVTVHLVDAGIDTGAIIGSALIQPTSTDNFVTYPLLQLSAGIPLMRSAIRSIQQQQLQTNISSAASRLWSHPGFLQYCYYRLRRGIK